MDRLNQLQALVPVPPLAQAAFEYWVDACQRAVLTLDVLRERGNIYHEHERSGHPPVLVFEFEVLVDARKLPQPANYALARILPPEGFPATDPSLRPFVVIDPRAGHGPGIGGFKLDSEIGIALQHGYPCYFVMFFPRPMPGQTIESVTRAEVAFLQTVVDRHPQCEDKPFVIGNCQGGWALMLLAASAPQLVGPLLLAGSPVSYWAGEVGKNPMRYSGGLLGGSWLSSLAGDLGNGRFDGAHLVSNFEQLNPANTYWGKLYGLYSKIDSERERFLEFERWWGGHFLLNKEEMEWIVQNLFVGNRLAAGKIQSADGKSQIDLRNIRSPIIVFASWGDNITPPQQALNWILDLYDSVEEIRLHEQTIVYCLHDKIGHLGIFVSAGIARRETSELASALDQIEALPPGLYEAVIEDTHPDMAGYELIEGRYLIHLKVRTFDDLRALDDGREDEKAFAVVDRVSSTLQGVYDTMVSPWVRSVVNEASAETLRALNPARLERALVSDLNPGFNWVKPLADAVRDNRMQIDATNPFLQMQQQISEIIERQLDAYRDARDAASEWWFRAIYDSPFTAALVGLGTNEGRRRNPGSTAWVEQELARLKRLELEQSFEQGSLLDGVVRATTYINQPRGGTDERPFNLMRRLLREHNLGDAKSLAEVKQSIKRQSFLLLLDPERAIAALPKLVVDRKSRTLALDVARKMTESRGEITAEIAARLQRIEKLLGGAARTKTADEGASDGEGAV